MNRAYFLRVVFFYLALGLLLAMNHLAGGRVSEDFQFYGNLVLLLIGAVSVIVLLLRQFKASRRIDKKSTALAREELYKDIVKKIVK